MKKLLSLNNTNNDIIDIIENINDVFDVEIVDIDDEKIIIKKIDNIDELINEIENKYNVIVEFKYINSSLIKYYDNIDLIELLIVDPINYNVIFDKNLLKNIFKDNIKLINENYDELNDEIIFEIVNIEIDEIFNKNISGISIYNLIELMNEILNNLNSIHSYNFKYYYIIKLFEYIFDDVKKFVDDKYINSYIKLNIGSSNILYNKHYNNIQQLYYDDVYLNYLYYDVKNNIDEYLIELLNIDVDDYVNEYLFYENNYINNLFNDNYDIEYIIDENDNYIIFNIECLFKMLYQIDNNNDNKKYYNLLDIKNIENVFECFNNSFEFDEFIYNLIDNEFELLYNDELYNLWNYTIFNYKNEIDNIYDLKKIVLNYLSNLNLNNSFKFDDELYEIY